MALTRAEISVRYRARHPDHKRREAQANAAYYAANRTLINAQMRARHARTKHQIKREAMNAYGKFCQRCGEGDLAMLALDHINDDGAARRKAGEPLGQTLYARLRTQGYPEGYQVLCHNCNHGKRPDVDHQHDDLGGMVMTGAAFNAIWQGAIR